MQARATSDCDEPSASDGEPSARDTSRERDEVAATAGSRTGADPRSLPAEEAGGRGGPARVRAPRPGAVRRFAAVLACALDCALAAMAAGLFWPAALGLAWWRGRARLPARRTVLFFSSGSSIEATRRKFGGVEFLLSYDGPIGAFSHVVLYWYPCRSRQSFAVSPTYEANERPMPLGALVATGAALLVAEALSRVRTDDGRIVRAWDPYVSAAIAGTVARLAGLPFCISLHADYAQRFALDGPRGAPVFFGSRALAQNLERWTLRWADRVFPIRESLVRYATDRGTERSRVRVFPHGVDWREPTADETANVRALLRTAHPRMVLSFAGRLSRENYVGDLIELACRLRERRDDFLLVVAGDGPERESLDREVRRRSLEDHIRLVGYLPRECVQALRAESHACLCLMGGFSLIESCLAARPVVAYDVEWHSELVVDGESGLLVPERDVRALARAVELLLDDPDLATRMGGKGRELALLRHSPAATARTKDALYWELLALRRPRTRGRSLRGDRGPVRMRESGARRSAGSNEGFGGQASVACYPLTNHPGAAE